MKLTKEDILNIDKYLIKKGIKYIDVRYELIDHLVTEYEAIENYPDLYSFLKERLEWCRLTAKKKQKAVNFGTTKALFKKFLSFFINFKSLVIIACIGFLLFKLTAVVSVKPLWYTLSSLYVFIIVYQCYLMINSGFGRQLKKESVSVAYLMNVFILTHLPLNFIGMIPQDLRRNPDFFIPYIGMSILLGISAILVYHEKRKKLLIELEYLKSSLV